MAVDREFYVYRLGRPRTGRTDGRAGGRTAGGRRTDDGRTGGRAAGTILNDSTTIFIDFHKKTKNIMFFCRFASGGRASTDFYSSNEKGVQKMSKNIVFFDFSNHARAQVPIFYT